MKVQFINPFIEAAHDVFGQITHKTLKLGHPYLKTNPMTSREVNIVIGVAGSVAGQIMYSMDRSVAIAIASGMMGTPVMELDDMAQSAVAEMGNILTGNAMIRLANQGYQCQITPPTIVQGKNLTISTLDIHTLSIPLHSEVGDITLDVSLKEY